MNEFWLFSSQIKDLMSISEVYESVSVKAEVACQQKTDFIFSASFVKFYQVFSIVIVENNDAFEVFRAEINSKIHEIDVVCL